MSKKVRLAFIGCGNIAGSHAARLAKMSDDATIVAFADSQVDRARALSDKHGGHAYASYDEMLERESLDAVLLCTPHFVRREAIAAITARKLALFCEKPPAFTVEEALACCDIVERAGIINTVGLMYRWANISDQARQQIGDRPVNICQITGCWSVIDWVRSGSLAPWFLKQDVSGGPMMDQGIHLLDAARYILQDDAVEVQAFGSNHLEPQSADVTIHDTIHANLRFAKGTVGSHVHCWSYKSWIFEIRFIGRDFELLWDIAHNRLTGTDAGAAVQYQGADDPYDNELRGFLRAVVAGDQSLLRGTYADACRSFATTHAAVQSATRGGVQPVAIRG